MKAMIAMLPMAAAGMRRPRDAFQGRGWSRALLAPVEPGPGVPQAFHGMLARDEGRIRQPRLGSGAEPAAGYADLHGAARLRSRQVTAAGVT